MKKYALETVVFTCGAVVMVLELVGSRLIAPYMGTSIIVWTSLIGIILASLSMGYWWGGALSDKNPNTKTFSWIILAAALFIFVMNLGKAYLLTFLQEQIDDIRIGAVIAAILLFAVPSTLLGMVSPYAVRLKMQNIATSGSTVGKLYAISTIGSIVGTFLAGFFLISYFGSTNIIFFLSCVLILTSLLAQWQSGLKTKMVILLLTLILPRVPALAAWQNPHNISGLIDIDTEYSRIWIHDTIDITSRRPVRIMSNDPWLSQSIIYLDGSDLYSKYLEFFDIIGTLKSDFQKAMMIGGAAFAYPEHFLETFPGATLDVVEIDPALIGLAKKYFHFRNDPRLKVYHEDGRAFLNRTKNRYDVILLDAFKANSTIPYQLITQEAVQKMYDSLDEDGVVLCNIVTTQPLQRANFLLTEYKTLQSIFPQVFLFNMDMNAQGPATGNFVLMALKSDNQGFFNPADPAFQGYARHLVRDPPEISLAILTDEFAPVDRYTNYGK